MTKYERNREYFKEYRKKNLAKLKEYARKWREANKDKNREYFKNYLALKREWNAAHPKRRKLKSSSIQTAETACDTGGAVLECNREPTTRPARQCSSTETR